MNKKAGIINIIIGMFIGIVLVLTLFLHPKETIEFGVSCVDTIGWIIDKVRTWVN
jgi:hypothetical protein